MKAGNEVAATLLWILVGFFILHVIQGTGGTWLKSFVTSGPGTDSFAGVGSTAPNVPGQITNTGSAPSKYGSTYNSVLKIWVNNPAPGTYSTPGK